MNAATETAGREEAFAAFLEGLAGREDRGALAALRRGLGKTPGAAAEAHRFVVPWLPPQAGVWEEDAYYLVASLFALHPVSWRRDAENPRPTDFGASMDRLAAATNRESVERRFTGLLNAHAADLAEHLRHAVAQLRSREVPVDWARLLRDVKSWNRGDCRVQRRWARSFWASSSPKTDNADNAADSPSTSELDK